MLSSIKLQNFKLFEHCVSFDNLRALNLITGINGRGKSSFLQALILFAQSVRKNENSKVLILNDEERGIMLGTVEDLKNSSVSISRSIDFEFVLDGKTIAYSLIPQSKSDKELSLTMILSDIDANKMVFGHDEEWLNMIPKKRSDCSVLGDVFSSLQYVSASRIEPSLSYDSNYSDKVLPKATNVVCVLDNNKGETAPEQYLEALRRVIPSVVRLENPDISINGQVEFWLSEMFGETRVQTNYVSEVDKYTMQFRTIGKTSYYKPTNVGYGYSYVLPILVAGLVAKQGSVLIVENPESHLHPQAQSVVAKFLACVALSGVQVFVESHSEHILNAFRVLVKQNVLCDDSLSVKFFDSAYRDKYYKEIIVGNDGGLSEWPDYFFDQEERDLNILMQ